MGRGIPHLQKHLPPPIYIYIYAHISLELVVQNVLEQFCLRTAMFPA